MGYSKNRQPISLKTRGNPLEVSESRYEAVLSKEILFFIMINVINPFNM